MTYRFDVAALIHDLGGAAAAAKIAGVSRTTPYRWLRTGQISSRIMERLKTECGLIMEPYFVSLPE